MPARIDEVGGDALLYVEQRRSDGSACIAVQTDEAKAMHFELTAHDVLALCRDLIRAMPTGCEHPGCYEEGGAWEGCQEPTPTQIADQDERLR